MDIANKDQVHYAIGIMSGTSLDGIDVAIVKISDHLQLAHELIHFHTMPYSQAVKDDIALLCNPKTSRVDKMSGMNMLLGKLYADASLEAIEDAKLKPEDISFISSHGQTIYHQPTQAEVGGHELTSTLQIGDISMIAERTGITTVGDFRTRDMAAGGQGAPLVPYADYLLFNSEDNGRIIVNIGGIANITVLPQNATEHDVQAYDTGPGNMVIDYFAQKLTKGKQAFDKDGVLASKGNVDKSWLQQLLSDEYFQAAPPKTTGREMYGEHYSNKLWNEADALGIDETDRIATITELTAVTLANEIKRHIKHANIKEVLVGGGGRYNPTLMSRINAHLKHLHIAGTDEFGVSPDAKEAIIFALLGYNCLKKETNNLPSATGASESVIMGKIAW